jgi:hypothetical protein
MKQRKPDANERFKLQIPYCLHQLQNGDWLVLNRNYKPIGQTTSDRVDYEQFEGVSIPDDVIRELGADTQVAEGKVWIYTGVHNPHYRQNWRPKYIDKLTLIGRYVGDNADCYATWVGHVRPYLAKYGKGVCK